MLDAGIVAPPGPVSAEALKFTLVKPLAGARTTTWVSTVSPRALDSAIKETVPAASVFPTRVRLGDTQTGNAETDGVTPTPLSKMGGGEFVALLLTVMLPVALWASVGANATVSVTDWLGLKVVPPLTPLALNPVPVTVTLEIVTSEFPVFVRVVVKDPMLPKFTFP